MKKFKLCSFRFLTLLTTLKILCGCTTMSDSLTLGISTGAVTGAAISSSGNNDIGSGAALGAVLSGLSSYFIHKGMEKRDEKTRRETLLNLEKYDVSAPRPSSQPFSEETSPSLTKPTVDVDWVETQVQGDKLIEGHRVWRIIEKSKWIPAKDASKEQK